MFDRDSLSILKVRPISSADSDRILTELLPSIVTSAEELLREIKNYEAARDNEWPSNRPDGSTAFLDKGVEPPLIDFAQFGIIHLTPLNKPLKALWEQLLILPRLIPDFVWYPTNSDDGIPAVHRGVESLRKVIADIGPVFSGLKSTRGFRPSAVSDDATVLTGWTDSKPLPNLKPFCSQLELAIHLLQTTEPGQQPSFETIGTGVSLRAAALVLNDGEKETAKGTKKRWETIIKRQRDAQAAGKSVDLPFPTPIGRCQRAKNTDLFRVLELVEYLRKTESKPYDGWGGFQGRLESHLRPASSVEQKTPATPSKLQKRQ